MGMPRDYVVVVQQFKGVVQEDLKTVVFHVFWTFYHRVIVKYFCDTSQR